MSTFDYVLGISDFSSGTVTFTSSPYSIGKGGYTPKVEDEDEAFVEEDISLRVTAGSVAGNLTKLREVQRLLLQSKRRQGNKALPKVFVFFKESASASQYRSEIFAGDAEWDSSALDREYWTGNTQWAEVRWKRGNWWEGPEAQIPLDNLNGSANTTGLTVYNVNDLSGTAPTKRVNYVHINAASVTGELDGLTRLELTNTTSSLRLYHIWVGHNYTDPANMIWFYDANSAAHSGTAIAASNASGGTYVRVTLSGAEADLLTWTLTGAQLDAFKGRMYKAIVRFQGGVETTVRFRFQLEYQGAKIWDSGMVSLAGAVYDTLLREIATLKMPPWIAGLSSQQPLDMVLRGYRQSGTASISIDSLQLVPVDGWRQIAYVGFGGTVNKRIMDDGIAETLYEDNGSGGSLTAPLVSYGRPITLRPGKDQRLYFQTHSQIQTTSAITRTLKVKVYYRPRRRSL